MAQGQSIFQPKNQVSFVLGSSFWFMLLVPVEVEKSLNF